MTMTPIHRIPAGDTESNLSSRVSAELKALGEGNAVTADSLRELISHDSNEETLSCCMDWAMQIRAETGLDWGSSIEAAMILFYG
jgi:hypothetical protein